MSDKQNLDAEERQKFFYEILQKLRPYPVTKSYLLREVDFHKLFDTIELCYEYLKPESRKIVLEWISFAKEDLDAYKLLYRQAPGLALYHIQQTVEKLVKAVAIFYGINSEDEVRRYNHDTARFFLNFYESEFMRNFIEVYPLRYPNKSKMKIDSEDLKEMVALSGARVDKSKEVLEKIFDLDHDIPEYLNTLNKLQPLFSFDGGKNELDQIIRERMGVILEKEFDKLISLNEKEDLIKTLSLYIGNSWGLAYILPFFSFVTPIWESAGRYPDEKKRIFQFHDMDYQDSNLIKYADEIIVTFKKFIKTFNLLVSRTGEGW